MTNLLDYPYEAFVEKKDDEYHCLIPKCDKVFSTYEEYLKHFKYNFSHFHYMKRMMIYHIPRRRHGDVIVSPIEDALVKQNIRFNKDYINLRKNIDVTWLVDKQIDHWIKNDEMGAIECVGVPGSGKSRAMISLAYYLAEKWQEKLGKETTVFIGFERKDTLAFIKIAKKGDVIIQDEDPAAFGQGSKTNEERLENLLKILRKKCISFIFVSPVETKVRNITLRFETRYKMPKQRMTKLILYTRKNDALGYVYIKIFDEDDVRVIQYEIDKDAFIEKTQLSGGLGAENFNAEEFDKDVEAVYDIVKLKDPQMKRSRIRRFVAENVQQSTMYQSWIADEVFELLKEDKYVKDEIGTGGIGSLQLKWELLNSMNAPDIGDLIYKHSRPTTEHQKLGKEWWKYYFCAEDGKGQQAADFINEEFDADYSKVAYYNTFFPRFTKDEDCFGKAVERAIHEKYYLNYKIGGGTGEPDLIGTDDYIEVKTRKKGTTRSINDYFDSSSYLWDYLKAGKNVKLVEVIYAPKRRFQVNVFLLTHIDVSKIREVSD